MTPGRVFVVVITRDRADDAARTAALLGTLPEHPAVIGVDNGSTDGTPERVRELAPQATVLEAGSNHGAAARNAGAAHAVTPYVAFSDDDSWWAPGALARATALLDDHRRVGLICACILLGPEERLDPICRSGVDPPSPAPRSGRHGCTGAIPALGATCRLGWAAVRNPAERRGFAAAVAGAGWVARQRRVVGPDVEARLQMLG